MHVAIHISERAGDARVQRIAQVEEKGAAGVVIVGEEDAARGMTYSVWCTSLVC
jgi:hypothetical protein